MLGCCVIMPTYNNATKVGAVIQDILGFTTHLIVVNDGSTDETAQILAQYPAIDVVSYPINKGKGWALRTGFAHAVAKGFTHAITIDSDGQHLAMDIPYFLEKLEKNDNILVIGARNLHMENMPGKNTFANKFSNFWFEVATGLKMPDTQSGFRLYPIKKLSSFKFFTTKYEFEVEVIVRAAWAGIMVDHIPIQVIYPKKEERISHFRPLRDFTRISVLNTCIVLVTFLWIKPRDFFRYIFSRSLKQLWKEQVLDANESVSTKAVSVGFGLFMGIVPLWGFQLAIGIPLAHVFRLNKVIFVLAANISIPPNIPFILFFSYALGSYMLGLPLPEWSLAKSIDFTFIQEQFFRYAVGGVALALLAGAVGTAITYLFLTSKSKSS